MPAPRDFVSKYAKHSSEEDFAETYAAWVMNSVGLWKMAIDGGSEQLMRKAQFMEELFVEDGRTIINTASATFRIPVGEMGSFRQRAFDLIRDGARLVEIEKTLASEYASYASAIRAEEVDRDTRPSLLARTLIGGGFGALSTSLVVLLFLSSSMVYVQGVRTWFSTATLAGLLLLVRAIDVGWRLESQYRDIHFYRLPTANIGLLVMAMLSGWLGGWLLLERRLLLFRFISAAPAMLLATIVSRWLLNAPDSRDPNGALKFGTRSALVGIYLAFGSLAFTIASWFVVEFGPK